MADSPKPGFTQHTGSAPPQLPAPLAIPYKWLDERLGIGSVIWPILAHPVPKSVNWLNTLGSATLIAFTFQIITGVFLALVYVPSPNGAYASLQWITNVAFLGRFLRGIHYWGGSAMIFLIFAHTARVFLTGSYKYPRELNWLLGVGLLFSTILMGFTGQLLVWNQDSYWAIVVGAEQAARTPIIGSWLAAVTVAGQTVGASTLTHFFAIHVFLVPGLMFLLIGGHLYLVVYQGIAEWPVPGEPVDPRTYKQKYHELLETEGVPFFPGPMAKDAAFALLAGIVVIILAITFGPAPLGDKADPTNVNANPRPFWFLIWYFALLALIPKEIEDYAIILFPALIILWMLALPFYANKGERAWQSRPWAVGSVGAAVIITAVLVVQGYSSPWAPAFTASGTLHTLPTSLVKAVHGSARRGAQIFNTVGCIACHKVDGVGGDRGPELDFVVNRYTDPRMAERILAGGQGVTFQSMPAYGKILSSSQMSDLLAFFHALPTALPRAKAAQQAAAKPASGNAAPAPRKGNARRMVKGP